MLMRQLECPLCGDPVVRTHTCRARARTMPPLVRMPVDFRRRIAEASRPELDEDPVQDELW